MLNALYPLLAFALTSLVIWLLFSFFNTKALVFARKKAMQKKRVDEKKKLHAYYQQKHLDLEQQLLALEITEEEFSTMELELKASVLELSQEEEDITSFGALYKYFPVVILSLGVCLFMAYFFTDRMQTIIQWENNKALHYPAVENFFAKKHGKAIEQTNLSSEQLFPLTQYYLQRHSDDAVAWSYLGDMYLRGQRPEQAEQLLKRALDIDADNFSYRLAYAQALVAVSSQESITKALTLTSSMLEEEPEHQTLWMTYAFALRQQGDLQESLQAWQTIKGLQTKEGAVSATVESFIAQLQTAIKEQNNPVVANKTTTQAMLFNMVISVDPVIQPQLTGGVLFIIAKQKNQAMPIAVKRLATQQQWPLIVGFSDADNLMPARKLSQALAGEQPLELIARYSFKGVAASNPGDYYSEPVNYQPGDSVKLTIDKQIK